MTQSSLSGSNPRANAFATRVDVAWLVLRLYVVMLLASSFVVVCLVFCMATVERLMGGAGLRGVRRGRRTRTTIPADRGAWPPDLVNRDFHAEAPNRLWVADLTYVPITAGGFACTAFVIDAFSPMITGWKVAGHIRA